MEWLSAENKTQHLLFTGFYYNYLLEFYLNKHGLTPLLNRAYFGTEPFNETQERQTLTRFFETYDTEIESKYPKVDTILYHSVNCLDLYESADYGGFRIVKKFQNRRHCLYVLRRKVA